MPNDPTITRVKYRAHCHDESISWPWRDTEDEALEDANQHRARPENRLHRMSILVKQTLEREI